MHAEMETEEEEEEEVSSWVYVTEVVVVIVLSLLFEYIQERIREKLEEEGKTTLVRMMDTLFREIMILGFIGLFVFICTKTGLAKEISKAVVGEAAKEGGEDPLAESFESIHMIIFCCITLMLGAERITRRWDVWEQMPETGREKHADPRHNSLERRLVERGFLDEEGNEKSALKFSENWYSYVVPDELRDIVIWRLLRHEFLFPSHRREQQKLALASQVPEVRDPIVFDFERYLTEKLGEGFVELVEVDLATWVVAVLFTPCIAWILSYATSMRIAMICGFSWLLLLAMFTFYVHISNVMMALSPVVPSRAVVLLQMLSGTLQGTSLAAFQRSYRSSPDRASTKRPSDSESPACSSEEEDLTEPLLHAKSRMFSWVPRFRQQEEYFRPLHQRSTVMKIICQHRHRVPNAQERLMWFEEYSLDIFAHMLEMMMFFQAVLTATLIVLIVVGGPAQWSVVSWVFYVLSWVEWAVMTRYLVPHAMSRLTLVTSIEYLKDPQLIEKVTFDVKRERLSQALKVLSVVKLEGKARRLAAEGADTISDEEYEAALATYKSLSEEAKEKVESTFESFDADLSGTVDCQEMEEVMAAMGVVPGTEASKSACALLKMVDKDGSGQLDEEEFKVLMVLALVKPSEEEEAEDLRAFFRQIDVDYSGSVSLSELAEAFSQLGVPMNSEEVGRLVYECFGQVRTELGEVEFVKWMRFLEHMGDKKEHSGVATAGGGKNAQEATP
ncbi:calcium binding protein, putative [Perkinsus marinus ATCC 50983]|uniref:Calmodulin n=1 Tax=Perkinsus marinus (strain ATCC 50983 / TXsc) TaxID=423536 RepID=C5KXI2_PERM5|nr:calcium binding protein, putative [Perkinsus marinus ATCC 50983]EER10706.1 calcium binding protein, putative [Perkinsus marinus ATCC 50983]|eukprot:XP_002778911.1 calcium binding protein, putative [Perkinsus marinus ATCC 50983]